MRRGPGGDPRGLPAWLPASCTCGCPPAPAKVPSPHPGLGKGSRRTTPESWVGSAPVPVELICGSHGHPSLKGPWRACTEIKCMDSFIFLIITSSILPIALRPTVCHARRLQRSLRKHVLALVELTSRRRWVVSQDDLESQVS